MDENAEKVDNTGNSWRFSRNLKVWLDPYIGLMYYLCYMINH